MKGRSEHETIANRTASTPGDGTATHRPRGRPRKKPRSSSSSPAPSRCPASVKRRKPRQEDEPRQDDVFAIKDIIDEKLIDGKRFFKIDWADSPTTGESFEPTWEPEENANEKAIEDWERERQLQARFAVASNSNQSQDVSLALTPSEPSLTGSIYVEVQTRADFLKSRPEFDTTSVTAISASQLSDCPLASQSDLPPSQFWVISSQPSQDVVIADSQPLVTDSAATQHNVAPKAPAGISQTTIPDSLEFLDELSQNLVEVPGTAEELVQHTSPKISNKESSGSTIPSHQPNLNQVSFAHDLIVETEHQIHTQEGFQRDLSPPLLPAAANTQSSPRPTSSRNPFDGFLTQPVFEPGEFSLPAEPNLQTPPHLAAIRPDQSQQPENQSLNESHQAAQIVSPLSGQASQFLTQTHVEFFSASEDYEVVPDSSLRNSGPTGQHQQVPIQHPVADTATGSVRIASNIHSPHSSGSNSAPISIS